MVKLLDYYENKDIWNQIKPQITIDMASDIFPCVCGWSFDIFGRDFGEFLEGITCECNTITLFAHNPWEFIPLMHEVENLKSRGELRRYTCDTPESSAVFHK